MERFKEIILIVGILCAITGKVYAQYTDGMTGLLHMPNAEMQRYGTLALGGNFLNYRQVPFINSGSYKYNTFNYFLNITFLKWFEVSYICTLNKGVPNSSYWPEQTWGKFRNQDRHFAAKILLVEENQWWKYMPAIVIGTSDPTTGQYGDYLAMDIRETGNGSFNRWYLALTKHFSTRYGELGVHAAYLYNRRTDYPLNGPAVGVSFIPLVSKSLKLIAEYDAKTINIGALVSMWNDHFNLLFEWQECRYLSVGLVYKVNLLGGNKWGSRKVFD